ncbi:MAG: CDGSH iron-sulfur domain-containing protein [Proteobacteria bacterium]|nr:CDGSH iron-sulfur domain-containing protein [Pseudomonadota bacterium]
MRRTFVRASNPSSRNGTPRDGSHQGTGLTPKEFTLEETTKVWLCMCKHTKNSPFCDGAHKAL